MVRVTRSHWILTQSVGSEMKALMRVRTNALCMKMGLDILV